jgi:hypothetical protein
MVKQTIRLNITGCFIVKTCAASETFTESGLQQRLAHRTREYNQLPEPEPCTQDIELGYSDRWQGTPCKTCGHKEYYRDCQ